MKFSIVTLFPEMFESAFSHSIIGRALKEGKIKINFINLRDFGIGPHKTVDDKPYGGGIGMVLRVDVLHEALKNAKTGKGNEKVVIFDSRGEVYKQKHAEEFSEIDHLILLCPRYEGFDERIKDYVDYSISVGDFILTGGEIPAMLLVDSVARLIPHVLLKEDATRKESFSESKKGRLLEHPQYTRPETYEGKSVPDILRSGHQANIDKFREEESLKLTESLRKDLIETKPQE